jgi:archaetidylinositol phosphate synthase
VATRLARNRFVTADRISFVALVLGAVVAPALVLAGWWTLAAVAFVLGDFCDYVDGDVARAQGTASDRGDILDGIVDRYVDTFMLGAMTLRWAGLVGGEGPLGPTFGAGPWVAVTVGLLAGFGAIMPSYVRALASANGARTPESIGGRGTRNALVVVSVVAGQPGWGLLVVALVGNAAATHRLLVALARSARQR